MSLNLAAADAALKEFYLPGLREQLNNETPILNIIEPKKVEVEGRRAVLSLHIGRSGGSGARKEGENLPTAGNQRYAEERVLMRYNYHRIELTGQSIRAMKSDKGSFVRGVESEMKGAVTDLKVSVQRQMWGASNGVLAQAGVTANDDVIILDAGTTDRQMRQFVVGGLVDIGTVAQAGAGSGGVVHGAEILSVDYANKTITIDSSVTTAATDFVFVAGSGGDGSNQRELTGLQTIVNDSGTLYNVDPSTHPEWTSYVSDNSGTPQALTEMQMASDVQQIQARSGEWPTHGFSSAGVHRAFANLLLSLRRYNGTVDLKGGYRGIPFAAAGPDIPVAYDPYAPEGTLFWLNANKLYFGRESDWEWMDEDGAVLSRVTGKDAYEGTLFLYADQFTDQRNAHGRRNDITEVAPA